MKRFIYQPLKASIVIASSTLIGVIFSVILSLLLKDSHEFTPIWYLIVGIAAAVVVCLSMRKFIKEKVYFSPKELTGHGYWVENINSGRYITKSKIILMLMPYFAIGAVIIILTGIFYVDIKNLGAKSHIGSAIICTCASSIAISSIVFALIAFISMKFCKSCGAVNSFIYDEDVEHISITAFGDYRTPGFRGAGDMSSMRAITKKHGDCIRCHCAKCKNEIIFTDSSDSEWSGL